MPLQALVRALRIPSLRSAAAEGQPEAERLSARRVIAQLSVQTSFYMLRDFVAKGDARRSDLLAGVSAELQPENAGAVYFNLACFRAKAGDKKRALASLRTAVDKGFRQVEVIETDSDLESLRGEKDYQKLVEELRAGGAKSSALSVPAPFLAAGVTPGRTRAGARR